jgi:hypothetical protein
MSGPRAVDMKVERDEFERAAHALLKFRLATGKILLDNAGDGSREALCWKREDGSYGVYMLNAAWWGWCAARDLPQPGI